MTARRFHLAALVALFTIVITMWLYWPLPALGVVTDAATGRVVAVPADSAAARGGIQIGDLVTSIYGHPWAEINTRLLLVPLPWHDGTPSPIQVQRGHTTLTLTLYADRPDLALQVDKGLRMVMALICWLTGVLLGASPQAANPRIRWTAWFWVILGGVLAVYQFAQVVSYVLSVALLWLLGSLLAPTAAVLHLWYPSRPMASGALQRAQRWWWLAMGLLQAVFLGLVIYGRTTVDALALVEMAMMLSFLGSFILSAGILWRAYRETAIAHIRRQIRLVAIACIIVACGWAIDLLCQTLAPQLFASIPPVVLTVVAGLIPLAYLYGGVSADLLRVDRLARMAVAHSATAVAILTLLAAASQAGLFNPTPMLVVIIMVAAYQPMLSLVRWLGSFWAASEPPYAGLKRAAARLGATLDADQLAEISIAGVRETFGNPPVALYIQRDSDANVLELAPTHQLRLPPMAATGLLTQVFEGQEMLLEIGIVHQHLGTQALGRDDADLVFAPLVSLWGIIRQAHGAPLGLVVLGPRGDGDPYREPDLHELERLLAAAGLAFTNSASYARQVQAQQLIRQLYRRLQQAQETTAAAIAREIHDEVLNINVRLNIVALEELLHVADDLHPELRHELVVLLESEQTTGTRLRLICDQLRPAYTEDPLGLATSLRRIVQQLGLIWNGQLRLEVEQPPIPVDRQMHRELVGIAQEAVMNAIKHAAATEIVVTLHFPFPATVDAPLILTIRDDGPGREQVTAKPKHLGLHFMRESADAIGATITWRSRAAGGTEVEVIAPVAGRQEDPLFAALVHQWDAEPEEVVDEQSGMLPLPGEGVTLRRREAA